MFPSFSCGEGPSSKIEYRVLGSPYPTLYSVHDISCIAFAKTHTRYTQRIPMCASRWRFVLALVTTASAHRFHFAQRWLTKSPARNGAKRRQQQCIPSARTRAHTGKIYIYIYKGKHICKPALALRLPPPSSFARLGSTPKRCEWALVRGG